MRWPSHVLDRHAGKITIYSWSTRVGGFQHAVVRQSRITCSGGAVKRHGLTGRVGWWAHDLATGLPGGRVGRYEVPACQRFRDPARYPRLARVVCSW
jgi:hypothetical protein